MSVVWVILGFILLVIGGEFLVRASVALSFKLKLSKLVIGMTVVSFATSAPELLVSLNAALTGSPAIAINNVVGSNIANLGLVLGITAMIASMDVDKSFFNLNWPAMMIFSMALYYFLWNDNELGPYEGISLVVALVVFLIILIKSSRKSHNDDSVDDSLAVVSNFKIVIWLLIGGAALYFGSDWLVDGAKVIARDIGVTEAVISVSMIAIGTSIPELAASIIAAAKKEKALSLGNLIGSNIFNIGSVLGLTSLVKRIPLTEPEILSRDVYWMLGFAAVLLPLVLIPKRYKITRMNGFALVIAYGMFIYFVFTS